MYLETILEHRVRAVFREITRDALQLEHHSPTIVCHRWNETQQGRRRMPMDPIIERCRQVVDIDGLQDVNDEFQPWYYVQWHYPDHNAHLSDSGPRSLPQAVAIYSATTVEILPLDDQPWLLDLYSSESLRDLVLADQAVDLTDITRISLSEARAVMILLDYVLTCFRWCASHQRRLHRTIRTITKTFGENCLPPGFYLSGVLLDGHDAIGGGGFADTFKGTLGEQAVCLKVLRVFVVSDPDKRKKSIQTFLDEAIIWRHLRHPNILPFLGISQDAFAPRTSTCFVSSFMANGDLMQFLKRNPEHDRTVCLIEIAKGLQYLHASNICHGDVKGANVLVDDDNHCRLADFGITSLICTNSVTTDFATITRSTQGSLRWMAPEVVDPSSYLDPTRVRAAARDVYAFACTSLEVMTGKPPFPELPEASVLLSVLRGERPARPQQVGSFTDELWNLIERCWAHQPEMRPTFDDITIIMGGIISREGS
ncbi:kinase-like domain-containing protein [Flagelloscypha sp. PMI_526]|nr:kinase-like domain-containing protein [Flagelloscypha sp. PMI_526]